ncbi:MAG: PBP1A family penicillin-binding protein [Candidatus Cloacimonetes bacterium]|nr:PBP1A family penicillin-binding protein [Candidatus Cloacimonadota bacterium]HPN40598.1 PBP1A family penicillin-binding protein [Candidatus Cloacimonadota bacterium]
MIYRDRKTLMRILGYLGLGFCVLTGIVLGLFWFYRDDLPPTAELRNFVLRTGSEVYDRNGRMIYLFAFEKRKLVSVKELPPHLIDALVVTEDKRFYRHFGIDPFSFVRAVLVDIRTRDFSQGASTITQQMARNMFLTLDKQVSRKMKEAILALRIEATFSKEEILEIYFNKIFWGGQIHGVETAALYYFNKHARDLSIAESAMLVGMIQRPNYYDPIRKPENAKRRRDHVLERMFKAKKISEEDYAIAVNTPVKPQAGSMRRFASDYFIEHIRTYLEKKYGTERLFEGGLRIYTTLDPDISGVADSVLNNYLANIENSSGHRNKYSHVPAGAQDIDTQYIQGGLVLMENKTGFVRALIGGRNFEHSKFNRMTQAKRQPGSSIKPTFYTLAIEKGYTPSTIISDSPFTLGNWSPQNAGRNYHGYTRMRVALTHSYNIWAVKCAYDLGLDVVNEAFKRFGLNRRAENLTAALGSHEIIPIDLISGFTTFPNDGMRVSPVFITKVEDTSGRILERGTGQKHRVCSPEVAYIMTSMLESVFKTGTGAGARSGYSWPGAGKTGTTSNNYDSWYIGFNELFTLGIWTGFDNSNLFAGKAQASNMWGRIMAQAIKIDNNGRYPKADDPRYAFNVPERIVKRSINPYTGFTTNGGGIEEVFIEDNIPPAVADTLQFNFYPTRWGYNDRLETR